MTDIAGARNIIQSEETAANAAVSESTMNRVGGIANFISFFQHMTLNFTMNGRYRIGSLTTGLDGIVVLPFNCEIVGCSFSNAVSGSSGTTTWDVHLIDTDASDLGSMLSVKPSINSTSPNNAFGVTVFGDAAYSYDNSGAVAGVTIPTFSTVNINQGQAIRVDLDSAMVGAQNGKLTIYYRPR